MGKKFKQILEGKHRHKKKSEIGNSTVYVILHDICTDKILTPDQKVEVIDRFCHDELTVQDVSKYFKNEALDS